MATCRLQVARGHKVWLVYGNDVDPGVRSEVAQEVTCVQEKSLRREISVVSDAYSLINLTRLLRRIAPDVVHTHTSKAGFVGRLAARRAGVPYILHGVHILPFLNVSPAKALVYKGLERIVAPFTDAFISVSEGMRRANLAAGLGTANNNYVVYSGMDTQRFAEAEPLDDPPAGRLIVLIASLEARKRHWEFLDVFARLVRRYPDLQLCCLGVGDRESDLRRKVATLGLTESVHFLGFRRDVERWIASAEVCVLPSLREGLPRAVVQYVMVGRPAVVTHVTGIEEILTDGENGFIIRSGRVEDMEEPLDRILSDSTLASRLSATARTRDMSRWSNERMEGEIERIINNVAARRNSGLRAAAP